MTAGKVRYVDVTHPVGILGQHLCGIRAACCGMEGIDEETNLLWRDLVREEHRFRQRRDEVPGHRDVADGLDQNLHRTRSARFDGKL